MLRARSTIRSPAAYFGIVGVDDLHISRSTRIADRLVGHGLRVQQPCVPRPSTGRIRHAQLCGEVPCIPDLKWRLRAPPVSRDGRGQLIQLPANLTRRSACFRATPSHRARAIRPAASPCPDYAAAAPLIGAGRDSCPGSSPYIRRPMASVRAPTRRETVGSISRRSRGYERRRNRLIRVIEMDYERAQGPKRSRGPCYRQISFVFKISFAGRGKDARHWRGCGKNLKRVGAHPLGCQSADFPSERRWRCWMPIRRDLCTCRVKTGAPWEPLDLCAASFEVA